MTITPHKVASNVYIAKPNGQFSVLLLSEPPVTFEAADHSCLLEGLRSLGYTLLALPFLSDYVFLLILLRWLLNFFYTQDMEDPQSPVLGACLYLHTFPGLAHLSARF